MLRIRHSLALLALLALTPACDGDSSGVEVDSETAQNIGEVDDAGEVDDDDDAGALLLGCSLEPACDAVDLPSGGDPSADGVPQASYGGDGLCVLTALTAVEPSLVQTVMTFDTSVANLDFAIVGPQKALRQSYGVTEGVGEWINPPMLCDLQGREFFENCLVSFDSECLDPETWVIGCEPIDELVCPATATATDDDRP